jgi:GNAT superfamily N-acetyltransferase
LALHCTFSTLGRGPAGQGYTYVDLRKASSSRQTQYVLQVEDIYVKSEHRRKGIGKALFKQLGIIAQEKVTAPTSST